MKIKISKEFDFEAAHTQESFPAEHKCRRVHGHSFKLIVSVAGEVDRETGMFYDHAIISEAVKPLIDKLDHTFLNDLPGLKSASMELFSEWLWKKLSPQLPGLYEIQIQETPRVVFSYKGD
jgi:6-pyruvoyltetrahydropterin/6-carboxytetrahydropterin synthase